MTAIGIYSLYGVENVPVLSWLDSKREYVRPYTLITSQWQRWNLFSPDPLRRVIQMSIEAEFNGKWQTMTVINEKSVGFWRRATELKTLRRMEEESMDELKRRYLHVYCHEQNLQPGMHIRMRKQWFVIPKHEDTLSQEWWNNWEPEWHNDVLIDTTCPETL